MTAAGPRAPSPDARPAAWRAVAVAAAALGVLSGCSALKMTLLQPRLRECESGFDVPLSSLVGTSRKELRVKVVGRKLDQDIPFVVEAGPESFVIVAFTPLGTKAFTLERRGDAAPVVQSMTGPVLPVPPRNIMADVLAMSWPSGCLGTTEGVAVSMAGGWEVTDTCEDSRAVSRRIGRPGQPSEIEVSYPGDSIVVSQKACRYTARYVFQGGTAPLPSEDGVEEEAAEAAPMPVKPFPVPRPGAAAKPANDKPGKKSGKKPAGKPAAPAAPAPAPAAPAPAPPAPVSAESPGSVPPR